MVKIVKRSSMLSKMKNTKLKSFDVEFLSLYCFDIVFASIVRTEAKKVSLQSEKNNNPKKIWAAQNFFCVWKMNFLANFPTPTVAFHVVELKNGVTVKPAIFNCSFCNQTFVTKNDLKEHKQKEHSQINQTIKVEPKPKKSRAAANQSGNYNGNYIPHQPKFQCEYCFKGFDQSHRLKQHQISHREPIYNCDQVRIGWILRAML